MKYLSQSELNQEFERQVKNLLQKNYPKMIDSSEEEFLKYVEPLKTKLTKLKLNKQDLVKGQIPFVIVINSELVSSEEAMELTEKEDNAGVTILRPHTSQNFKTIDSVSIPKGMFYLLLDIDRGQESLNLAPQEALEMIQKQNRSPLTVNEGIAIVTHFPEFLIKNNCFSLLASRTGTDKRVPAIWINGKKEPNIGWCWDGNPHTWLGSASAASRIGAK